MQVDRDVRRARCMPRGLHRIHVAPRRQIGNIRSDIGPGFATVARHLHLSVITAGPDHSLLLGRFGDRHQCAAVFRPDVVAGQPARRTQLAAVVQRQKGTDYVPGLASVLRHVQILAADVNDVVVVRGHGYRERPVEPVLQITRRISRGIFRPDLHRTVLARALVVAIDTAADTARARSAGPDNIGIGRVGNRPPAFAAAHGYPLVARNHRYELAVSVHAAIARPAERWTILAFPYT